MKNKPTSTSEIGIPRAGTGSSAPWIGSAEHDHLDHRRPYGEHDHRRVGAVDADEQRVAGREHRQDRVDADLLVHLLDREQRKPAEQCGDRDQRRGRVCEVIVRRRAHHYPFAR
jgi:hypothetical protein